MVALSPATVVIAAHARPPSLARLLASLDRAHHDDKTDLVISIDGGAPLETQVLDAARSFHWPHGSCDVVHRPRLGLVDHFLACGDLTEERGPIVLLEDDLVVGPGYHRWATLALACAEGQADVAGVCLSAPWFDGYRHLPFEPIDDGSSGFYAQVPWFHGMAWTPRQWKEYRAHVTPKGTPLHRHFDKLTSTEWFPEFTRYLVATNRYYLLPRVAHATNWCDPGEHFSRPSDFFQVPISLGTRPPLSPLLVEEALAVYDDHMELDAERLKSLCPSLDRYDLAVDLLGVRDLSRLDTEWVITTKPARRIERSWGATMRPLPMNLAYDVSGSDIHLAPTADVIAGPIAERRSRSVLVRHHHRGRSPGLRSVVSRRIDGISRRWVDRKFR